MRRAAVFLVASALAAQDERRVAPRLELVIGADCHAISRGDDGKATHITAQSNAALIEGDVARFARQDARVDFGPDPLLGRDAERSFTLECSLRTTHNGFCTPLMCREGNAVHYSLVLGRRPGTISFEVWSWDRDKAISVRRIDDGKWHDIVAAYDAGTRSLALFVDDELQSLISVSRRGPKPKHPMLRLGNNIGAHQPYRGSIRGVRLRDGVPAAMRELHALRAKTTLLEPRVVHARMEQWLVRHRKPRRPQAESRDAWKRKASAIRAGLQDALGLSPPPYAPTEHQPAPTDFAQYRPSLDLAIKRGGALKREHYELTRIYWQTIAAYWASGYLYEPTGDAKKLPAVLCPHGHWRDGSKHPVVQARCITLANNGYVVLAVDSIHVYDEPIGLSPLSLMTWNNLRGLELLRGLPQVDPARIGCTGASGGGQQTFYLTGLNAGLAAAVPAVMVCYFEEILLSSGVHCLCNFTPGLMGIADEPELSAAFAPTPQMFLSVTGDWTKNFPAQGLPEIRSVYRLFDAEDRVDGRQWESKHDYNRAMRNVMYAWFERWLKGTPNPRDDLEPPEIATETATALRELDRTDVGRDLDAVKREFRQRLAAPPLTPDATDHAREKCRTRLARRFGTNGTTTESATREVGAFAWRKFAGTTLLVKSEPEIEIPLLLIRPAQPRPRVVLLVGDGGKSLVLSRRADWIAALLAAGHAVALADVRYTGELDVAHSWREPYGKIFGRDPGVVAVHDIRSVVTALASRRDVDGHDPVLVAFGTQGAPALFATALDPRIAAVVAVDLGPTYRAADRRPRIAGILRHGDLPDAACLIAPRPLVARHAGTAAVFAAVRACYEARGAAGQLVTTRAPLSLQAILRGVSRAR